jgi:hypothetical protein
MLTLSLCVDFFAGETFEDADTFSGLRALKTNSGCVTLACIDGINSIANEVGWRSGSAGAKGFASWAICVPFPVNKLSHAAEISGDGSRW